MENENQPIQEFDSFDDMSLPTSILKGIYQYGFETPSAIQKKAIVPFSEGKNIIAQAQSGTGKTGAFSIGLLSRIDFNLLECQALILAPTHELAFQITRVLSDIGEKSGVICHTCVGGTNVEQDIDILSKGVHVVIGTPGRTYDMLRRENRRGERVLDGNKIKILILDEADEMLSKEGFQDIVYDIMQKLGKELQIGLFSATMPTELLNLVKFIYDPVKIIVKTEELTLEGIRQFYVEVEDDNSKISTIVDLYKEFNLNTAVVFCKSQRSVDFVTQSLLKKQFPATAIHGSMDSETRKNIMKKLRSGATRMLITTDLLARGIDVQQVSIVINYDLPNSIENYLHRIGRSGRFGRKGIAINFVTQRDASKLIDVEKFYNTHIEPLPTNFGQYL